MARVDRSACLGSGKTKRVTDLKVLVEMNNGDLIWIPKTQIHDDSEVYDNGHEGRVVVTHWWAKENALI